MSDKLLHRAISESAANLAQKAIIDMLAVKITRINSLAMRSVMTAEATPLARMKKDDLISMVKRQDETIVGIFDTLRLTRAEVAEIRLQPEVTYADEKIQEILSEAVDKITAAILDEQR